MAYNEMQSGGYAIISFNSGSGISVCPRPCDVLGLFVSVATVTSKLAFFDSAGSSTATPILTGFIPTSATYYPLDFSVTTGLFVVCVAGSATGTVFFA